MRTGTSRRANGFSQVAQLRDGAGTGTSCFGTHCGPRQSTCRREGARKPAPAPPRAAPPAPPGLASLPSGRVPLQTLPGAQPPAGEVGRGRAFENSVYVALVWGWGRTAMVSDVTMKSPKPGRSVSTGLATLLRAPIKGTARLARARSRHISAGASTARQSGQQLPCPPLRN